LLLNPAILNLLLLFCGCFCCWFAQQYNVRQSAAGAVIVSHRWKPASALVIRRRGRFGEAWIEGDAQGRSGVFQEMDVTGVDAGR